LESIWDVFLGKRSFGIYLSSESKFLKNKTINLKQYMFYMISRYQIAKELHVVDVIELAVERVFGLHKVAGS